MVDVLDLKGENCPADVFWPLENVPGGGGRKGSLSVSSERCGRNEDRKPIPMAVGDPIRTA